MTLLTAGTISQIQYGVLPWRRVEGVLEFLLITTRNTRRWIVPKGWPLPGRTPRECAAQEALEEAGILGDVAAAPLGWFHYDKLRKSGEVVPCKVQVYPMEVTRQRRSWVEKSARQTNWCSLEEALARVAEPGLRQLILKFSRTRLARRITSARAPARAATR
jgi:8-oxo-dGTP pyrophosphatase MutT (NUDIX family)